MRIMIDTNIFVSAILYPLSDVAKIVAHIKRYHTIVICEKIIIELERVFKRKFPDKLEDMHEDLESLIDEVFEVGAVDLSKYPDIRDTKDLLILINAIESRVEIFITGDNDFYDVKVTKPRIMTSRQYINEFMV